MLSEFVKSQGKILLLPVLLPLTIAFPNQYLFFKRLVTSSVAPYRVIFANAAFSAMTGLPSDETLGRPLHEVLNPGKGQLCLESLAVQDDVETAVLSKEASTLPCLMNVTPVLSNLANSSTKTVTHFAVDLTDSADGSRVDDDSSYDSRSAFLAAHFQVMA